MQLFLVLCILGLLSLSEQSKRAAIRPPGTDERAAKRRRVVVPPEAVAARLSDLQCRALGLKEPEWHLYDNGKKQLLEATNRMWLMLPSSDKFKFVGLTIQGEFEALPAVPDAFSKGDHQGTHTDVVSIFPKTVNFDVLISRLQNYVKQAGHTTLTSFSGKSATDDPMAVLKFFTDKVSVENERKKEIRLVPELWDLILYRSNNPDAIDEMENLLLSGKTDSITIDQFMGWLNDSAALQSAVKTVAPYLLEKHIPSLYRKGAKDQVSAGDEGESVISLSLNEKLLVAPVILAEGKAMLDFVDAARTASASMYSMSNDRWSISRACGSTLKTLIPYVKSPTASTIDWFLLQAASRLLNNNMEVTADAGKAADTLNEIYRVVVDV